MSTKERAFRVQVVTCVALEELQRKLLSKKNASTEDIIRIARTFEEAKEDSALLRIKEVAAIHSKQQEQIAAVTAKTCFKCNQLWIAGHRCVRLCYNCGLPGHIKKQCQGQRQQRVSSLEQGAFKLLRMNINRVGDSCQEGTKWFKELIVDDELIKFKIDTGAEVNAIPRKLIGKRRVRPRNMRVCNYNAEPIKVFGTVMISCIVALTGERKDLEFFVVNDSFEPILGLESCVKLRIVKRIDLVVCSGRFYSLTF